jgi:exopolyphosphatase/guanosine-5'-triphosphate,3'-diphosphate pyrophosphatase
VSEQERKGPTTVAAVDLGSNSFHMIIGRLHEHDLHIVDRLKEPVRLAEGLDEEGLLSEESQARCLACLERFGQRLAGLPKRYVRAVGTNTLRRAANARAFALRARKALGHPIEVIPGQEEARLIYLGMAHSHAPGALQRMVVDIGGGSTEIIVGEGFEVLTAHSLYMGCVSYSRRFFPDGAIGREAFRRAETAASLELRPIRERLRRMGWKAGLGTSGTVNAVAGLLQTNDLGGPEVTPGGMKRLRKLLVQAGHTERLGELGVRPDRAPVLPGGLAILIAVFRSLGIESLFPSSGALREGVLYDLLGRIRHEDVRDRTIRRLVSQYRADLAQATRVERTARGLLEQVEGELGDDGEHARRVLRWAARLHEIGLTVSHTGHHKHGAYLVLHSDMPGFSRDDQRLLAALIRGHRRKLSRGALEEIVQGRLELALRLCVLLRLAVLMTRSRSLETIPLLRVSKGWKKIQLEFSEGWLAEHPLTLADVEAEAAFLKPAGIKLVVWELPPEELPSEGEGEAD